MAELIKHGSLEMHDKGYFSDSWVKMHIKLYRDSNILVFQHKDNYTPKVQVRLQTVSPYFGGGRQTEAMPNRPDLPKHGSIDRVIAFPTAPSSGAPILWLLCANDIEFNEWMAAIHSVVPNLGQFYPNPTAPPPYQPPYPYGPPGQQQPPPYYPPQQPYPGYYQPPATYQPPYPAPYPQTSYPSYAPPGHVTVVKEHTTFVETDRHHHHSGFGSSSGAVVAGMATGAILGLGAAAILDHRRSSSSSSSSSDSDCDVHISF